MQNRSILTYTTHHEDEFKSTFYGVDYVIELRKNTIQAPFPIPGIDFAGDPIVRSMLSSGDPITAKMKPHEFVLNLNSITDMEWLHRLPTSNFDWQIRIKRDGQYINTGYLVPDIYVEPYNTPPYPVSLSFVCGLAMLREIPFADQNGCYLRGWFPAIKVIAFCLSQLRNDLNIADCINIRDEDAAFAESYLAKHYVDVEAFKGLNCYEVIERIIPSGNRITQYRNRWEIAPINQVRYGGGIFDRNGDPTGIGTVNNTKIETTAAQHSTASRAVWTESSQQLEIVPGWRDFKITHEYGKKESILPSSEFEKCDFFSDVPRGWSGENVRRADLEEESCLEFKKTSVNSESYIQTTLPKNYVYNGFDRFRLTVEQQIGSYEVEDGKGFFYYTPTGERRSSVRPYEIKYTGNGFFELETQSGINLIQSDKGYDFIIFDRPLPFAAKDGWMYWIEGASIVNDKLRFRLTEGNGSNPLIMSGNIPGDVFNVLITPNYNYYDIRIGQRWATQANNFDLMRRLLLEINQREFVDKKFFTQTWTSALAPDSGQVSVRLRKPLPKSDLWGNHFLKSAKLEIIPATEKEEHKHVINDKFNFRDNDVSIYFAPIKRFTSPELIFVATRTDSSATATFEITFHKQGVSSSQTFTFEPINIAESAFRAVFNWNQGPPFNSIYASVIETSGNNEAVIRLTDRTGDHMVVTDVTEVNGTHTGNYIYSVNQIDPNQQLKYWNVLKYENTKYIDKHKLTLWNTETEEFEVDTPKSLLTITEELYKGLYNRPRWMIYGQLNTAFNLTGKTLYDKFAQRFFAIKDYENSLKNDTFDLTCEEFIFAPGGSNVPGDFNEDFNNDFTNIHVS